MHTDVTLTADDFRSIHNGLCDLRHIINQLEETLHPIKFANLQRAEKQIRGGLASAYNQEQLDFEAKRKHYEAAREHFKLRAEWSLYEVRSLHDEHPYGSINTVYYADHWGEGGAVSCPVNGKLWIDLYVAADNCIRKSGDTHHAFIESFQPKVVDDVTVLNLSTGS